MGSSDKGLSAWSALLAVHARALRRIEGHMKANGIPPLAWYDLLWELERAGGGLRIGDLAERLVIERYNMTRLLDRLEEEELVVREHDKDDRRSVHAVLTAKGRTLRATMWPHYKAAIEKAFVGAFEPDEIGPLADLLRKAARTMKTAGS